MKKLLSVLLLSIVYLAGCQKDKTVPAMTTGSISGTISPAVAVARVTASLTIDGQITPYTTTPDKNGAFKLTGLPAGSYTLSFTVASGYSAPTAVHPDTVTAGRNTEAGTIVIAKVPGGISGTISPAGAATAIYANATINGMPVNYSTAPDNNGNFKFAGLPAGTYALSYQASAGYKAPASTAAVVTDGQMTNTGNIAFSKIAYGSISGTITPAGAATEVRAYSSDSGAGTIRATPDPVTGVFKFEKVPTGSYIVSFTAADHFTAPATSSVIVSTGQNTDAGSFSFTRHGETSVLTLLDDGTSRSLSGTASYQSGSFSLQGSLTEWISRQDNLYINYNLKILLDNVTGPGTYACKNTATSQVMYTSGAGPGTAIWDSTNNGSSATVTITSIDPAANAISGTFTATLQPFSPLLKTKIITNGIFTATYR